MLSGLSFRIDSTTTGSILRDAVERTNQDHPLGAAVEVKSEDFYEQDWKEGILPGKRKLTLVLFFVFHSPLRFGGSFLFLGLFAKKDADSGFGQVPVRVVVFVHEWNERIFKIPQFPVVVFALFPGVFHFPILSRVSGLSPLPYRRGLFLALVSAPVG